ncbi:MAG: hypothetical protein AAFN30_14780 [Actinomycetota bacterium]
MTTNIALLLTIHLLSTAAMAGLIWFVQIVHYPLFDAVGEGQFISYEQQHTQLTGWVVGPFMAVEGITALAIAAIRPAGVSPVLLVAGLALLAVIHASTVWLQVPAHGTLVEGFDPEVTSRLVATNWIRTVGWSGRALVAGAMILAATRQNI